MCNVCFMTPCHSGCPNAPESTPIFRCCRCKEEIFEGEQYLCLPNGELCEACLEDMTVNEFLEFTGEKLSRAEEAKKAELEAKKTEDEMKGTINEKLSVTEKAVAEVSQEFIEPETDLTLPFTAEKIVVLKVQVGENNLDLVKDFFESINIEYEVMK